jgi:hypothetical protein
LPQRGFSVIIHFGLAVVLTAMVATLVVVTLGVRGKDEPFIICISHDRQHGLSKLSAGKQFPSVINWHIGFFRIQQYVRGGWMDAIITNTKPILYANTATTGSPFVAPSCKSSFVLVRYRPQATAIIHKFTIWNSIGHIVWASIDSM